MTEDPGREAWSLMLELFMSHHRPRMAGLAADFELTPMQMLALKKLEPGHEVPTSTLADSLMCDASNVTGIVDRLEARGLIERRSAKGDRRKRLLAVTEEGARLRERIARRLAEPPEPLTALSATEQRQLRDLLRTASAR